MDETRIEPLILGRGTAGRALAHALGMFPLDVAPPRFLERGLALPRPPDPARALLVLANPHALHTPRLLEAAERGYRFCLCEKPAAVDRAQVAALDGLALETWVCHGYRMLWGPHRIRQAREEGRFGRVISVEGRYWQSSAAQERPATSWKDDPALGGRFDVLLDLATHWADLVGFVLGETPGSAAIRRWYVNAAAPHRDTHLHLHLSVGDVAAFGSISKTVHGAGNTLDLHLLGERAAARWSFSEPDVVEWGEGSGRLLEARSGSDPPARLAPFHGLGWLEGYARIVGEVVGRIRQGREAAAPTLADHLRSVGCLLDAAAAETSDTLGG